MKELTLKSGKTISLNQAFNMDCLDFMKELPDKCIDLVLTDPPYGKNIETSGTKFKKFTTKGWDKEIPSEEIFNEIFRVSKNQIIWGGNYFTKYLPPTKNWIIWDKNNYGRDFADCEMCWCSFDKVARIIKKRPMNMDGGKIHPTQKPLKVFNYCIDMYAGEDDIILDPFMGSFTGAISAYQTNRSWLGCEKDPDYFKAGYHRYEQETKQLVMEF